MSEINTYSVTIKVEEENLAVSMGSGSLCVLATPCVVALMENAAAALADKVLDNDELTTVGTMIQLNTQALLLSVLRLRQQPFSKALTAECLILKFLPKIKRVKSQEALTQE